MSIFNSLGSNYDRRNGSFSLTGSKSSPSNLKDYLAKKYGARSIFLTYKGREAMTLILQNLDIPQGSYVVINGFTCYAVYQSVIAAGLKPYYLDIDKVRLNFSAESLSLALNQQPKIKAVIVQNTLGLVCDIEAIEKICRKNNLRLIEDLAHSAGLNYGRPGQAGTIGDGAAFSFGQGKMLDAVTGGAAIFRHKIALNESDWRRVGVWQRFIARMYPWTTYAVRKTFWFGAGRVLLKLMKLARLFPDPMTGTANIMHRLPAWHSGLALRNFRNLGSSIEHRQTIAAVYQKHLPKEIQAFRIKNNVYLRFPIFVSKPQSLIEFLKGSGIYLSDRWYDAPIAPKRLTALTDYRHGQCPNAELASKHILNLPTHWQVSKQQALYITEEINKWLLST